VLLRALLVFFFFLFLARAVWRLLEGVVRGAGGEPPRARRPAGPSPVRMARCPVCGTYVVPGRAPSEVHRGETVYFCSDACRARYAA
jgi:YHS domain-containing protein